jgi:phenylacetate-CoA ligase
LHFFLCLLQFKPEAIFVIASPFWGYYDKILYCLIAKILGIKSYFNNVSGGFVHFYEKNKLNKWIIDKTIKIPNVVVLGTPFWMRYFRNNFPGLNLAEIANPVIYDNFNHPKKVKQDDVIRFVSAFRITKDKGIVELVKVIKEVCNQTDKFQFTILGDGPEYKWMCDELELLSRKGMVRILGFLEGKEKVHEIVNADAYLMLTHFDMMPIAILEAMSAGLAIFTTNVGGIPDMVREGENAVLFNKNETTQVTSSLLQFAGQKEQLRKMGEVSREIVAKNYNIDIIINKQLELINNQESTSRSVSKKNVKMSFLTNIIFQLQGLPINKATKDLEQIFTMSVLDKKEWIEKKKWEMVRHHFNNNETYRKLVGEHIPNKWSDLPFITKQTLQGDLQSLISKPYQKEEVYVGNTSGSSGHPFYFAKDKYTHALTWAYIRKMYALYDINPYDLQARFYGIPLEKCGYRKEKIKDFLLRRVRFSVFNLSDENIAKYVERFKAKKFKYIYGYTNSIVLFSRYLIKNNIKLNDICPTLKLCIVTSELCNNEDKTIIEQAIGVPVVREYGASELCLIAFDLPEGKWLLNNSTILVETEQHENGGKIYCTSLFNKAFPMIRYEIGDIGKIETNEENGQQYLVELLGRTNDNIILPSGKVSPGLTFYYISRSILESSGVLKEFIIKQTALNEFVFEVVSDAELSNTILEDIKKKAELYLESGLIIKIIRKDFIDRPVSGKIKHFYSLIK